MHRRSLALLVMMSLAACGASTTESAPPETPDAHGARPSVAAAAPTPSKEGYRTFLEPERLQALMADPKVVLVDVRTADEYAKGHIPGAINVPGDLWRTPSQKGGKPSHDFFTKADGTIDVARYEGILGGAGIAADSKVVVYGNHAGKADGDVPMMVLVGLGHKEVGFVDGVGLERWKAAGNPVSTEPKKLAPVAYKAQVASNFVWNVEQVKQFVHNKDVVFVDARSPGEFAGTDARDNKRSGHVPGAVNVNYEDLLTSDKRTIAPTAARTLLEQHGITRDKKVVVYCQTGTRAAHNVLVMRDLGYTNVSVYDGSWQEWGNREDTPVEKAAPPAPAPHP